MPSCSASHAQPRWPLTKSGPRCRRAQSPSLAYTTLSTFSPSASSISTSSPPFASTPVQPPITFVTVGYFPWNTAISAAITRYPPGASVISFVIVKSTPLLMLQPRSDTEFVPMLCNSTYSSRTFCEEGRYISSLMTMSLANDETVTPIVTTKTDQKLRFMNKGNNHRHPERNTRPVQCQLSLSASRTHHPQKKFPKN